MSYVFFDAAHFDQSLGGWDIQNVAVLDGMLLGTALSVNTCDSTLLGWAAQEVHEQLNFACSSQYSSAAQDARATR
jgi:hypothetical protein